MRIETVDPLRYLLFDDVGKQVGKLEYKDVQFDEAEIETDTLYKLKKIATGMWSITLEEVADKVINSIKVGAGGVMNITGFYRRRKYTFKKSTNWKMRFALENHNNDELIGLIPSVNWEKNAADYILQLNEELETEYDAFLILQAVHCANCGLSMMEGGSVPALVSV